MNDRGGKGQAGFTILDFFVFIAIIIFAVLFIGKTNEYTKARYKTICTSYQRNLQAVLEKLTAANDTDPSLVLAAYTVYDPNNPIPYRMVVITKPDRDLYVPDMKTKPKNYIEGDMTELQSARQTVCPMRKGGAKAPVIDYFYIPSQRWYCLNSPLHN